MLEAGRIRHSTAGIVDAVDALWPAAGEPSFDDL
jgi:hypothetical protein